MTCRKIVTLGKTLVAMSIISLSLTSGGVSAAQGCKLKDFEGRWMFSEDGTTFAPPFVGAPFSEVGWAIFDKDGQGYAEGFVSIGGLFLSDPGSVQGVALCNFRVEALDEDTCVATAAFELFNPFSEPPGWDTRTLTVVLDPDAGEFRYTSSSGDQTVLGTGKKSKGKNWNYTPQTCPPPMS